MTWQHSKFSLLKLTPAYCKILTTTDITWKVIVETNQIFGKGTLLKNAKDSVKLQVVVNILPGYHLSMRGYPVETDVA